MAGKGAETAEDQDPGDSQNLVRFGNCTNQRDRTRSPASA